MAQQILMMLWLWIRRKGRVRRWRDSRGHLRVLCWRSGQPIQLKQVAMQAVPYYARRDKVRWTRCVECDQDVRVTGLKSKPKMRVHNAANY